MDAATAQFLQDTLKGYTPVVPAPENPYTYLNQGFNTSNQVDGQIEAQQHIAAADQAFETGKQHLALAAAQAPYDLALLKAKTDAIPLDAKYNQAVQGAKIRQLTADADKKESQASSYSAAPPTLDPIAPPAPIPDGGTPTPMPDSTPSAAASSTPSDLDQLDIPSFNINAGAPSTKTAPPALLGPSASATPAPDPSTAVASAYPTDLDLSDLAEVHDADDPEKAVVWHNGVPTTAANAASATSMRNATATADDLPTTDDDDVALPGSTSDEIPSLFGGTMQGTSSGATASTPTDFGGYRVPISQADMVSQRNYFNQRAAAALANPALNSTPRNQRALQAQLRAESQQLTAAENVFRQSQRQKPATSRSSTPTDPAANPLDSYADVPGFTKIPVRGTNGKVEVAYQSDADAAAKTTKNDTAALKEAQEVISRDAGGASLSEFLNATPVPASTPGGPTQYSVTHTESKDGVDQPVTRTIPQPVYDKLMGIVHPLVYGSKYTPASNGATASPATPPLPRVKLALGPNAAVLEDDSNPPPVAPAPVSTQDRLQDAIDHLPPGSDVEQQAAKIYQQQQDATQAAQADVQAAAAKTKTKDFVQAQQVNPLQQEVAQTEAQLKKELDGVNTTPTSGDPVERRAAVMADAFHPELRTQRIASLYQSLRTARAKLAAANDPDNYTTAPDGSFLYKDPFRTNAVMTGQTQTTAGATTTRSVN